MGGYHLDAFRSFCHHLVGFLGLGWLEEGVCFRGEGSVSGEMREVQGIIGPLIGLLC